jgi:hypothetical protein
MDELFKTYFEKSEELKRQTALLLRTYSNPKSTSKEFHEQRAKVSELIIEHNKIKKEIEIYL